MIWDFVREMDHWAHLLPGYRSHEKQGERESLWTVQGDVGVLARTVQFRVCITEWSGPERVRFELVGVNEPLQGEGSFRIERVGTATDLPARPRHGLLRRGIEAVLRFLLRLRRGRVPRASSPDGGVPAPEARLTFSLRVEPGGPMAPMIDALMKPAMQVAAEDLAQRILAALEQRAAS